MRYNQKEELERYAQRRERDRGELPPDLFEWREARRRHAFAMNRLSHGRSPLATKKQQVLYGRKLREIIEDTHVLPQDNIGLSDAIAYLAFETFRGGLTRKQMNLLLDWLVEDWSESADEDRAWVYTRRAKEDIAALLENPGFRQVVDILDRERKAHGAISEEDRQLMGIPNDPLEELVMVSNYLFRQVGGECRKALLSAQPIPV